jgi:outer membrane protein assembly factor BamB
VVTCESGNVYLVNVQTGEKRRIKNPDAPQSDDRPSIDASIRGHICVLDGVVYIGAQDNRLYAVDIDRGKIDWKFSLAVE